MKKVLASLGLICCVMTSSHAMSGYGRGSGLRYAKRGKGGCAAAMPMHQNYAADITVTGICDDIQSVLSSMGELDRNVDNIPTLEQTFWGVYEKVGIYVEQHKVDQKVVTLLQSYFTKTVEVWHLQAQHSFRESLREIVQILELLRAGEQDASEEDSPADDELV